MTSTSTIPLDPILRALKDSPLFQLSLASKELFHSNFLAWLCETYPNAAGHLFARFFKQPPLTYEHLKVDRERNKIDLWLEYSGGEALIIENKVKSLPTLAQLQEYTAKIQNKAQTSFLLLSLTRPTFLPLHETTIPISDGVVWHSLTYRELASKLRDLLPDITAVNSYHGQLLRDYTDFITQLDALQARFIINWDDDNSNFFGGQQDIQRLRSIRLHDVIDKMRYAQMAQQITAVLRTDGFRTDNQNFWRGQVGQVFVDHGMTRGTGLFDFKYCLMNKDRFGTPVILGIQIQGADFRLVVEVGDRIRAPKIAAALRQPKDGNQVWFNFGLLPSGSEERPKKHAFNQYSGQFLYRWKRIESIAPQHLVDIIVAYAHLIRANETILCQQIEAIP